MTIFFLLLLPPFSFQFSLCCCPQKLYRFINCVELVSPHHAARELVHTLRKGHITSLFQKSVKRVSAISLNQSHVRTSGDTLVILSPAIKKVFPLDRKQFTRARRSAKMFSSSLNLFQKEDEQRRRRKSKAQFFEMIQEIRRWAFIFFLNWMHWESVSCIFFCIFLLLKNSDIFTH